MPEGNSGNPLDGVSCTVCGAERPAEPASGPQRPPCPACGATTINVRRSLYETIGPIVDIATITMTPADQTRDWHRRWTEIQTSHSALCAPRGEGMDAAGIQTAVSELHAFFVKAYHLKDTLKAESGSTGISGSDVENRISNDPALALLADLANLEKHAVLKSTPRSGAVLKVIRAAGTSSSDRAGWKPSIVIEHNGRHLDGVTTATAAFYAWKQALQDWGLI